MNLKRLWYILTICMIAGVVFYLGFLFGNREFVNDQPDDITVVGPNSSRQNSFSDMIIKDIYMSKNSRDITVSGQLYYKIVGDKTEILIKLVNVPTEIKQSENNRKKNMPTTLLIETAQRVPSGMDYKYTEIGEISFDEPINGLMTGTFTTIVDFALTDFDSIIERIVFTSVDEDDENLFIYPDPNLPANVRNLPTPYFWIVL